MMASAASAQTSEIHLDSIGQIALTVNDLAESRDFYRHILGMKWLFDAGQMAFFQCGSVRLMIGVAETPVKPEGTILYFNVADILGTSSILKDKGVVFLQEPHLVARMQACDLWMAFIQDPTGNTLALMSEVQSAPA